MKVSFKWDLAPLEFCFCDRARARGSERETEREIEIEGERESGREREGERERDRRRQRDREKLSNEPGDESFLFLCECWQETMKGRARNMSKAKLRVQWIWTH